jgi:hypothetical protein
MPTYTYKCPDCGTTYDVQHGMSENMHVMCSGSVHEVMEGPECFRVPSAGMVQIAAHNETRNGRKVHIPARNWL